MKRTDKKKGEKTLAPGVFWWRKTGGGSFHTKIDGKIKIIKPNDRFAARLEEIPEGFRDVVIPADKKAKEAVVKIETASPPTQKLEYYLNHRGGGYYDILDKKGKRQNAKALRKEDADALIKNLVG